MPCADLTLSIYVKGSLHYSLGFVGRMPPGWQGQYSGEPLIIRLRRQSPKRYQLSLNEEMPGKKHFAAMDKDPRRGDGLWHP